ncbi:UDP-N-acetylmuramoylalanine--D-glutamate ligase [Bienertia sinuspersici]
MQSLKKYKYGHTDSGGVTPLSSMGIPSTMAAQSNSSYFSIQGTRHMLSCVPPFNPPTPNSIEGTKGVTSSAHHDDKLSSRLEMGNTFLETTSPASQNSGVPSSSIAATEQCVSSLARRVSSIQLFGTDIVTNSAHHDDELSPHLEMGNLSLETTSPDSQNSVLSSIAATEQCASNLTRKETSIQLFGKLLTQIEKPLTNKDGMDGDEQLGRLYRDVYRQHRHASHRS